MRYPNMDRDGGDARPTGAVAFTDSGETREDPSFSALLTPHRSLVPRNFLILMGAIGGVSFAAGMAFVMVGAWPVFGFFMLDVLLIYWAFRLNYRSGKLYETVDIAGDVLTVTRVLPSGRSRCWAFNPYWARCEISESAVNTTELSLASHGNRLVFGSFLTADEKRDFAEALTNALRASRGDIRL